MNDLTIKQNNTNLIKENVKECYQQAVKGFFKWLGENEISLEAVQEYRQILISANSSASKINNFLFGIRGALKSTLDKMDLPESKKYSIDKEINNIKLIKTQRQAIDNFLNYDEYQELLKNTTPRMRLILEFLFSTGCRVSEALNINLDSLNPINGHCEIQIIGKGNKQRKIKVATALIEAIKNEFSGINYLFETKYGNRLHPVNVTQDITALGKRVLNKHISAHTLRHTFATYMIDKTKKIKAVSRYLGHSTAAITLDMYTHESLSLDELGI